MKPAKVISPWGTQDDRKRGREMKFQAVLLAAVQAFNEKGYYAASLDDVAKRLHVTKPTLYHYFNNKEEILFECLRIALNQLKTVMDQILATDANAIEKLRMATIKYAEATFTEFGTWAVRAGEEPLAEDKRKELRKLERYIDSCFRELIESAVTEGYLIPCNTKMVVSAIAGTINWSIRWYKPGGALGVRDIAEQVNKLVLEGLLVRDTPVKSASVRKNAKPSPRVAKARANS